MVFSKATGVESVPPSGANSDRQKIAYFTINDPRDKRSWSGITYYMGRALQQHVGDVDFLGPVQTPWLLDKFFRATQKLSRLFFGKDYIPKYSLLKNIHAALILKRRMRGKQYDFVFAPAAASELAYLNTDLPIVYFADATYKLYSEAYHKEFRNQHPISRIEGNHLEKRALKKSDLVIFSCNWAAESAINDYGISKKKIEVLAMGANIEKAPDRSIIFKKLENPQLTLLFLSVDWDRKGGPIAFGVLQNLLHAGVDIKLIVCGCVPPSEFHIPGMTIIPFLNKNDQKDFRLFEELLAQSHFLLLPTRADCTPLVNCEANAYGIPVITTDVGGVTDTVFNGINGYCLPFDAGSAEYAGLIDNIFSDKNRYQELIISSRDIYDQKLNWNVFADSLAKMLRKHNLRD